MSDTVPIEPNPDRDAATLAVFISGSGRTLHNLHERIEAGELNARIGLVVASRVCEGSQRAHASGLQTMVLDRDLPPVLLAPLLQENQIDLVVLAGYTRLLPIPPAYRGRVLNIHPALLPDFGGPGMHGRRVHEEVIRNQHKVSGCTVHFADDTYDTGPIILHRRCDVLPGDTPETLAARVFELERQAYPEAINLVLAGAASMDAASGTGPP